MLGIAENISSPVRPATEEGLNRLLDDARVADLCARIRDAHERCLAGLTSREDYHTEKSMLKKGLPILTPHATFGPSGRRTNQEAVPTGLFMMDYDDIQNPEAHFHTHVEPLIGAWGIVLAAQTPGGGLRVIATIPRAFRETMTPEPAIAAAQMSFADASGLRNYDQACKDLARCSFAVPRDYVFFLDMPRLLAEAEPWPEIRIPEGYGEHPAPLDEHAGECPENTGEILENSGETGETPDLEATFRGLKYKDIIREWFRQTGGEPQRGERNSRLHQLACNLRGITDNDANLILRILPAYGLSLGERRALITSALKGEHYGISASMKRVLRKLENPNNYLDNPASDYLTRDDAPAEAFSDAASDALPTDALPTGGPDNAGPDDPADDALRALPPMPERLPRLVDLLLRPIPDVYRAAVAHAIFPALATHLWKTFFPYADNELHECTLMNVLLAETGAGKNCITKPINLIMHDIRERDRVNRRRENEWKREMATRAANVDKSQRPAGLVIQEINPDVTNAAFVMRLHEADGHFLYTRMNEIDQFDALRGNGRAGQQFQIMCLAFDPDNQYGQTRVGWNSVTENVQVRFNWNASSTISHGRNYFRRVALNGPLSRINFCTIPRRPIGARIPVYGRYSPDEKAEIGQFIDTLNRTTGTIVDPRLTRLAEDLMDHCRDTSITSQDRTYENLSFRACVIAWLKVCCLYAAGGLRWEDEFRDFALWSLDYDLTCKMAFFGEMIDAAQAAEEGPPQRRTDSLLALLPPTFSRQQAQAVRKLRGKPDDPRFMLSTWKRRGLITQNEDGLYVKTGVKC